VRAATTALILSALVAATPGPGEAADPLPRIVQVAAPSRLRVGETSEARLVFRASAANVVAVLEAFEDLDGPPAARTTREREIGVVARAFGREDGELTVPLRFATPGWKRVTVTLMTDERELSDPAVVELEVVP
jgi:hypothetical protein